MTALSAEHFELVQNAIFQKPCYSKVFGGGLFYLRRALPPQTPPLLTYRNVQHSFSTDCAGSNSPPDCCSQLQRPDGRVKLELVSSHSILFAPKNKTTHRVVLFFGAGDEARTRYLDLGKVALYQMSYARRRHHYCSAYGASGRGRTGDTRIFSPLLYQLSYRGIWRPRRGSNPRPPA